MPLREGPRARLQSGIAAPRDRAEIDITIHRVPVTAWPKCPTALSQQIFDVSKAQREMAIKPHGMLNDPERKAMAAIRNWSYCRKLDRYR